ncbi:MAG: putative membrane protein [Rhodobacteraceae bacterium HLUCCA08]|nr:MAG: putative membrane protein [Rhodobacteraceae bacterium HLUCCA08]
MTAELTVLALGVVLQLGQFVLYSLLAQGQVGTGYALSARDEPRQLTGRAGRAQRALNNQFESLALFTPAVLVITLSDQSTGFTAACAWAWLAARVAYVPAYLLGLTPWRSLVWGVGFFATLLMILAALI